MSMLDEETVVAAFAERLKQIKVANGYLYDLADANVHVEEDVLDPSTSLGEGEYFLATIFYMHADFPSNGNNVIDFDQVADIQLTCAVRTGFEQRVRPLRLLKAIKQAAFTPVGGNDVLSQNLNSLIPSHASIRRAQEGEAWTQITFIVTARWCDDLEAGDDS